MSLRWMAVCVMILLFTLAGCGGYEKTGEPADTAAAVSAAVVEPTPDEKVAELKRMCAEAGPAMASRQAAETLYERAGGREGIMAVVDDTVERHLVNDEIKHLMEGVDAERLKGLVTDFIVVGTGGEGEYHGRDMVAAHAHLELTHADFLSAGGDLGAAMDAAGWGEDEKQELLCAFVAHVDEVIAH